MRRTLGSLLRVFLIMMAVTYGIVENRAVVAGEKDKYILSYSPGTLFHQIVRDKAKLVYERAGIPAEFIALPHNRSLMSANDGRVDGDVGRVPSVEEKYPNLRRVAGKLMDLNGVAYTIRDDIATYDESLLSDYRVGYVLGVRWTQKKMKHLGLKGVTVRDYNALIELLIEKRVDLILATEASAESVLRQFGARAQKVKKLKPYILSAPIYHYVNKDNQKIIPRLEAAVHELRLEGGL